MTTSSAIPLVMYPDPHHDVDTKTIFGFWVYLMTDCLLFAALFATYAVLHSNTFGGPSSHELFHPSFALAETLILLTSSFTCGLAMLSARHLEKNRAVAWFAVTFLLGVLFLVMEMHEFTRLVNEGNSWQRSAFLSAYFTLVGTHGLHVTFGLLWIIVLIIPVVTHGLTSIDLRRLTCLSLFWHFLDIIWIFIFTFVYLIGVI